MQALFAFFIPLKRIRNTSFSKNNICSLKVDYYFLDDFPSIK